MSWEASRPYQEEERLFFIPGKESANEKTWTLLIFLFLSMKLLFFFCCLGICTWFTIVEELELQFSVDPNKPIFAKKKKKSVILFVSFFLNLLLLYFQFTILYWFCHTSTCIRHGCTCVPHSEPHLPPPSPYHPSDSTAWRLFTECCKSQALTGSQSCQGFYWTEHLHINQ